MKTFKTFSTNKKEVLSNIISLGSIEVLGLLIPIVTMPLLTRTVGANLYGQYLLLITIINFGYTIIDFGVQYTGVREASRIRDNKKSLKNIYEKYQGLRLVLSCVFYFTSCLYVFFFVKSEINHLYYTAGGLYLVGYVLTSAWFFQAIGHSKLLLKTSLVSRFSFFLIIVLFVRDETDIELVFYAYTIPVFISSIYLYYLARNQYQVSIGKFDKIYIEIKAGLSVFIGLLAPNLYNSIPTIILGTLSSPVEFSIYAIATRLGNVILTFMNVVSKSIYPILVSKKDVNVKYLVILNILISMLVFSIIAFVGNYVIKIFFGIQFLKANEYLIVLSLSMVFVGISNAFSQGFFLVKNKDKMFRNIAIFVSIPSAIISYYLIINYSFFGAVYGLLVARVMFAIVYFIMYIHEIKKEKCEVKL